MSLARLRPLYVSFNVRNNKTINNYIPNNADTFERSILKTDFRLPILEKASDYLCAVERMELSLNGIPFYDASDFQDPDVGANRETLLLRSRINNNTWTYILNYNCYSLSHLFEYLNSIVYYDPTDNTPFNMTWSVNKDGFIVATILGGKTFSRLQIEVPRRLNNILGISITSQQANKTACNSTFPRMDLGDDLDHIILVTNLPTNSDSLGNVKNQVLTDFSVPSTYSNSLAYGSNGELIRSGFQTNIRQKIIYTPSERRYLELIGDFPITNIMIEAYYVNTDGIQKYVPLPLGGYFEIKLGFYLRQ
jgi:hypothetical protein